MTDNFSDIMEAARQMQKSMAVAQEQLSSKEETGKAADGQVTFTMNGHNLPTQVRIDDRLAGSDLRTLEKWILAAAQEAARKVEKTSQDTIMSLTEGIGLPPEMNLLEEE